MREAQEKHNDMRLMHFHFIQNVQIGDELKKRHAKCYGDK